MAGSVRAAISRLRPWLGRIQGLLAAAIVVAMAILVVRRWDDIRSQPWQISPGPLVLATTIVVAALLVWAVGWAVVVRRLGAADQPVRTVAGVYIYSNLARYLPGAVWNLVARAYLGHQQGLGQRRIWTATVIDLTVAVATGLVLYTGSVAAGGPEPIPSVLAALGAVALLAFVSPPVLRAIDRRLGTRAGGPVVLRWREFGAYLAFSCVIWAGIGGAFYLFVAGLYPVAPSFLSAAVGIWSLSVVVGLLAIGVPQGLGIKEGLLVLGLSAALPVPVAAAIAIASRLWMICCDLLAVGIWWTAGFIETRLSAEPLSGWPAAEGNTIAPTVEVDRPRNEEVEHRPRRT